MNAFNPELVRGLGQGYYMPPDKVAFAHSPNCKKWLLAYTEGDGKAHAIIEGTGFSYGDVLGWYRHTIGASPYFTFTGTGGTFVFKAEYDKPSRKYVIRICVDGMDVVSLSGWPMWLVKHRRHHRGTGQVPAVPVPTAPAPSLAASPLVMAAVGILAVGALGAVAYLVLE